MDFMLTVDPRSEQESEYLAGRKRKATVGAANSPGSITLSVAADAIETLSATLPREADAFNRPLRTGGKVYYYSHHMAIPLGGDCTTYSLVDLHTPRSLNWSTGDNAMPISRSLVRIIIQSYPSLKTVF